MTKKQKGVTLIELVIVLVVFAALVVIAVPKMSQSAAIARKYTCKANINMLNCAIEKHYLTNWAFPANLKKISQDKNLFLNGEPTCPVTNEGYPHALGANNRVDASEHDH